MAQIKIAAINASTCLKDDDIRPVVDALQAQVSEDFAPVWKIDADVTFVPKGADIPTDHWWLAFLDQSDQAGAAGYHDETPMGLPQGKIFAADDLASGTSWTNTASHEILEMLADPEIVECTVQYLTDGTMRLVAREICDPMPNDSQGYQKNGVLVANFVTRDWFVGWSQGFPGVKYDFLGQMTAPFELLDGGYIGVMNLQQGAAWTQVNARGFPHRKANTAPVGSRRERRKVPKHLRVRSTVS